MRRTMDLIKQEDKYFTRWNKDKKLFEQVCYYTGKTTPLDTPTNNLADVYRYDRNLAQAICELVREGKTIASIGRMPGFPLPATIYNWKRLFPGFDEMLEASFKDRAYLLQDRILDDLDEMGSLQKDEIPAKKLQVDTTFKLMEKANPEKFGAKVQLSGDKDAPLQFIIDTGIRRKDDAGFDQKKFDAIDVEFTRRQNEGIVGDETEVAISGGQEEEQQGAYPIKNVETFAERDGEGKSGDMGSEEQSSGRS